MLTDTCIVVKNFKFIMSFLQFPISYALFISSARSPQPCSTILSVFELAFLIINH